ncbi:conserved hypothetical protein [Xenorhabdus bovienii str. oregonense]|uniref:Uncharacterized protein n=1 Tax=Xenorhabdus bovienii str. oregonense TaxID=1398202 RepID=A0A077P5T9_XENBV|nr:conserved hypothetical protein [Xenorhabdus bovienii str. oregonense]
MACETKNIFDNHKTLISKEHWKTEFSVLLQVTVNHKVFLKMRLTNNSKNIAILIRNPLFTYINHS